MDWKEKYQALFGHIVEVKYGRPIDFPAIERKVSHLRDGDVIRYEDLEGAPPDRRGAPTAADT